MGELRNKFALRVGASNVFSRLFFLWQFPFIWTIKNCHHLKELDLELRDSESCDWNDKLLETEWSLEKYKALKQKRKPAIRTALFRAFGSTFILNAFWKIIWALSLWFGSYWLLKQTIIYVGSVKEDTEMGQWYAMGFLLSSMVASISIHQLLSQSGRLGFRIKSALMVQIYKKTLVISHLKGGAGGLVNLISNDCQKIAEACTNFQYLWSAAIEVLAIIVLAFIELGMSALPAVFVILLMVPVLIYMGMLKSKVNLKSTAVTSERIQIMSEILSSIKLIKFYAWEIPFHQRITDIRKEELALLKKNLLANSINFMVVFCIPVLVVLFSLLTYLMTGNVVNPVIGFTIVCLFNTLRYPLLMAPLAINSLSDATNSLRRLDNFFAAEEIPTSVRHPTTNEHDDSIVVKNSTFKWDKKERTTAFSLKNLNFSARKGKLTAIVGDVGSGKSSLLAALLGQMNQVHQEGECKFFGSIAYMPQESWLLNTTFRENALFGSEYKQEKYEKVIEVCGLNRDLKLMAKGDQTEIGERGINLSGGQRQRLLLARAVYKSSDIILLDDPLSALDQTVGQQIFSKCIKDYLHGKTVLLVTHQLQYMNQVDEIIVLKNGEIIEQGNYEELINLDGHLAHLLDIHAEKLHHSNEFDSHEEILKTSNSHEDLQAHKFIPSALRHSISQAQLANRQNVSVTHNILATEHNIAKHIEMNQLNDAKPIKKAKLKAVASVTHLHELMPHDTNTHDASMNLINDNGVSFELTPGHSYLRSGLGTVFTLLIFAMFFLVHGAHIVSDYWLSKWFAKSQHNDISDESFITIYLSAVLIFIIGAFIRGLLFSTSTIKKSIELHDRMLNRVIYARMAFFDSTPLAKILDAFASHQYTVDAQLSDALMQLLQYLPLCFGTIMLIMYVIPKTIAVFIFGGIMLAYILLYTKSVEDKLRKQDALSKTSIFCHLTAALEGLFCIRAHQTEERFIEYFKNKIDDNHKYQLALIEVKNWVAFYLDILTSFIIYFIVLVAVTLDKEHSTSTSGLVVANILQLLVFLQWTVRMFTEVREKMASVKQVTYYGNSVVKESPPVIEGLRPPSGWPHKGRIQFQNVVLKYQEFGIAILKGVSINIKPKEKVGIVGRTGSGKSTLLISLMRIVEASEGRVIIDGIDVSKIGLRDLRDKITIIPQEPVLFFGSIRDNIDLFGNNTDEEIWEALDSVNLGESIRKMEKKLDAPVIENGKNFSVGERQLFCLARALCSKSRILVLDEASAAVDIQTDRLIQKTIKEHFTDFTVMTIAHRLNTIIESDKILVMDAGKVVEFAQPLALLRLKDGHFTSLVNDTGKESCESLKKMAYDKAAKLDIVEELSDPFYDPDNVIIDPKTGLDISKEENQHLFYSRETVNFHKPKFQVHMEASSMPVDEERRLKKFI